jgi:Mn-dependent DtxR family transcriptional regulator
MKIQEGDLLFRLLQRLNERYEAKFYDQPSLDELSKELSVSKNELEIRLAPLIAAGWVKKDYHWISLTHHGKEEYDRQTGNVENMRLRERVLEYLAAEYEKRPDVVVDSESLAPLLGVDWNKLGFNLERMEERGFVELRKHVGAGHWSALVSLTPFGKAAHDNPMPRIVFLSHAAMDRDLAMLIKSSVEECFAGVKVFATTDPEASAPGDPWIKTIFENLEAAQCVCVLGTERGLSRKWVWLETGAGWARFGGIITCCVGVVRKSSLPVPFSWYTALDLDSEEGVRTFFDLIEKNFGKRAKTPDFHSLANELTRLDARIEEKHRLETSAKYAADIREQAERGWKKLDDYEKQALRQLFIFGGQASDRQVMAALSEKGVSSGSRAQVFQKIQNDTGFIQRAWPFHDTERVYGYEGPWQINPQFKNILEELLFP